MPDTRPHSAVGGVLAQIANAIERLAVETTPDTLLNATARELTERLGAELVIVSRRDGDALQEVTWHGATIGAKFA